MSYIDLHVHSTKSDGTVTPADLVRLAKQADLSAFALTDHDTVAGVVEARAAGEKEGIRVITGAELSALYEGKDIHILGLNLDETNEELLDTLAYYRDAREGRNEKMAELLRKQGFDVTLEKMEQKFPGAVLTRAHFARYLLDAGYTESMAETFEKYIGDGCPCYVPKEYIPFEKAIPLILHAGGHPVLAHPLQYRQPGDELEKMLRHGIECGLEGIEAIYTTHTPSEERRMKKLAKKYSLFITGGSDFHGSNKPKISLGTGYGNLRIPEELLEPILK